MQTRVLVPLLMSMATLLPVPQATAQGRAVVPPVAADLPGNAAMSMPLRWSHGSLQVLIGVQLLPANFLGQQIQGIRLRRPAFLGEPPYAALQRTITVRAGFTLQQPQNMNPDRMSNVPVGVVTVAGPTVFQVGASAAPTGSDPLGAEFLVIPFTAPLPVVAGNLFLEFEATDAPLTVGDAWIDAVWYQGGVDHGHAVTVGDGNCTLSGTPLELRWNGTDGPLRGSNARLRLIGVPPGAPGGPGALTLAWVGVDPQGRGPELSYLGYGGALGAIDPGLAGCFQWAPLDLQLLYFGGDAAGGVDIQFAVPAGVTTVGMRLGVQAAYVDPARTSVLPVSVSNGVMLVLDSAGVGSRCNSLFFPGTATSSPWGPQSGLMPVLVLDY